MDFGLSHYAIGIRADVPTAVTSTISYWLTVLMSCSPTDPAGGCPDGNLASLYEGRGGTGTECGYVQYPAAPRSISPGTIIGFSMLSLPILLLVGFALYWMRLKRRHRLATRQHALAGAQAVREREINEFIAREVKKPLGAARAALVQVYARCTTTNTTASCTTTQSSLVSSSGSTNGGVVVDHPSSDGGADNHNDNNIQYHNISTARQKHRAILKRQLDTIAVSLDSIGALVDGLGKRNHRRKNHDYHHRSGSLSLAPEESALRPGHEMLKFDRALEHYSSKRSLEFSLDGMLPSDE
jgi:hypothetical protein